MSVGVGRGYLKMYRRKKYLSQYFKEREEKEEMKNNYDMYKCEICCEMFNNRYSSLVHNASHIIIPLARMSFQICQFCLKFFNSLVDLKTHLCEDHGFRFDLACEVVLIRLEDELRSTDTTLSNCVFDVIEENVDDVMERQESFNDEVKIKTDNDDVLIIEKSEIMNPDYIEIDNVLLNAQIKVQTESKPLFKFEDEDNVEKLNNNNQADDIPVKNLGDKTIFEDDVIVSISQDSLCGLDDDDGGGEDDDDGGGNDDKNKKWFPNGYQPNISFKDDSIGNANSLNKVLSFSAPIDYETLVHPGEFSCKRCNKIFQNRLLLIQHETSHMQWRRPRPAFCTHCDRYIARGPRSLHEHVMHCHPDVEPASKQIPKGCTICGLKYVNYTRHRLNYHTSIDAADNIEEESTNENRSTVVMKTMDLCELCYSFFKIRRNCKYVEMGECEFKGRRPCEKCGKEYFVLKSVKRMTITHSRGWKHRKGPLSNQDRLKMIHKRLKNMR